MNRNAVGILIVLIGILAIFQNMLGMGNQAGNFVGAGIFMILYLLTASKKGRGFVIFLVIASMTFFYGAFEMLEYYFDFNRLTSGLQAFTMAIAFFSVDFIHYRGVHGKKNRWTKVMGIIFSVIGCFAVSFDYLQYVLPSRFWVNLFPVILILIGAMLFIKKGKVEVPKEEPVNKGEKIEVIQVTEEEQKKTTEPSFSLSEMEIEQEQEAEEENEIPEDRKDE